VIEERIWRISASPAFCGSLPNCGHRPSLKRYEQPGCHAFQIKPREDYALMKAKTIFSANNGQTSRLWRTGDAICQGSDLPKLPICAKLYHNRPVIRRMSANIKSVADFDDLQLTVLSNGGAGGFVYKADTGNIYLGSHHCFISSARGAASASSHAAHAVAEPSGGQCCTLPRRF
jgi:hypothetical protein